MSAARPALAGAVIAAAVGLSGCQSEQAPTARSVQALNPQLVSLMTERGMSSRDPMLLRIYKEESKAEVWKKRKADGKYALLKSYDICRFSGKLGPKIKEGDKQAPEGFYSVGPAQMNPRSNYYLSFNIGFPNAYDRALGRSGQHVMMHGDCLSAGCYAMTDAQMGEIYAMARESFAGGQRAFQVQAFPFRMTAQNMARRRNDKNIAFWKNLKQGSDNFEVTKAEPKVNVCGKKYVFNASAGPLSIFEPTAQCPSYQVEPQIAKAVAAKEKADGIVIAQLSKQEAPAPEYVAQNGRLRRTLDQPIVMVAQLPASPAAMTAAANAIAADAKAEGAAPSAAAAAAETKVASTASVNSTASVKERPTAAPAAPATVALKTTTDEAAAPQARSEGGFFTRMFRSDGEEQAAPAAQPATLQPGPTVVAAKSAPPVPAAKPGPRTVGAAQPVMAAAVSPAPEQKPGLGGWLKSSVGGLFGSKEEQSVPAPEPTATPAVIPAAPPAKARNRQAALPEQFLPAKPDRKIASAFAEFE